MRAVSDHDLERFLVDDLDAADAARVAAAVAADAVLAEHVAARRADKAAWAARAKPIPWPSSSSSSSSSSVATTPTSTSPSWIGRLWAQLSGGLSAPALLASAACIVAFVVISSDGVEDGGGVRARGSQDLQVVVKRGEQTFRFQNQPLREGDAVRIGGDRAVRGGVVSVYAVDVRGDVSVLADDVTFADDGYLPGSFILDASVGPERWLILRAPRRLDGAVDVVRRVVRHGDDASQASALEKALPGVTLQVFSFEKDEHAE